MKIRINGNSIRIRLSRSEVDRFGTEGFLEERTEFGDNTLIYTVEKRSDIQALSATFTGSKVTMMVPENMMTEWISTDIVGYNNNMDIGNKKSLFLLLEKDFKCIDNAMEDQSDNYENPHKTC